MTFFPGQVQMYGGTPPGDWPQITPDDSSDPFSDNWQTLVAFPVGRDTVKHVVFQAVWGGSFYTLSFGVFTYTYGKDRVLTQTRFTKIVNNATAYEYGWFFGPMDGGGFYCVRRYRTGGGLLEMVTWDADDNFITTDLFQSAANGGAFICPNGFFVTTRSSDFGRQIFKATPGDAEYWGQVLQDPADDYSFPIHQGPSVAPDGFIPWVTARQEGDDLVLRVHAVDITTRYDAVVAPNSVAINFGNYDNTYDNGIFTVATAKDGYYLLYERPAELPGPVMTDLDNFYVGYRDVCARKIAIGPSGISWAGDEQVMGLNLYGTPKIIGVGGVAIFEALVENDDNAAGFGYYGATGGGFSGRYSTRPYDIQKIWQLWAACVAPPLRMLQRNDGLGKVGGSAPRLGEVGATATSRQAPKTSRIRNDGGQAYL
jgi:hypothetical protein